MGARHVFKVLGMVINDLARWRWRMAWLTLRFCLLWPRLTLDQKRAVVNELRALVGEVAQCSAN